MILPNKAYINSTRPHIEDSFLILMLK